MVEDDEAIGEPLATGLRREGFDVTLVNTAAAALSAPPSDLVLLDLGLPDAHGFEVCRQLRARSSVPIIIVTARDDETDRVVGLELGADDYVAVDPGAMVTRREILSEVWDPHWYGTSKTVDVHIASLRKKLGSPTWIETSRGVGFRLAVPQ